VFSKT